MIAGKAIHTTTVVSSLVLISQCKNAHFVLVSNPYQLQRSTYCKVPSQRGVWVPFCEPFCQKSVPREGQLLAQFVGIFPSVVRFEAHDSK